MQVKQVKTDTLAERIEFIREARKLTKTAFAKSIFMTPQGYRAMVKGNYCQPVVALAIEYVHGYNKEWVLEGEGERHSDKWTKIKGEVEEELIYDLRNFFRNRLKEIQPIVAGKAENGSYEEDRHWQEAWEIKRH